MITTIVGNYPRTPNWPREARLRKAIHRFDRGEITREELHQVEDEVTVEVIQEQIEAGVDLITDGQVRWDDGQTYFAARLAGFAVTGLIRYFDTNTYYRQPVAQGAVKWTEPITVDDWRFATAHSSRPVKAVITGPYTLARLSKDEHYSNLESFVMALAEALNQEARALQAAGASFIQFDEPAILRRKDDWPLFRRAMGVVTQGLKVTTALYTYFGDVSGLYPQCLNLPCDVIGLDFAWGAKNWEVLPTAPFSKALGFGIVDARNTKLEDVDTLVEQIRQVSRFVPVDRLYVNPSCGLEFLPRERAQEKLVNMVKAVTKAKEVLS